MKFFLLIFAYVLMLAHTIVLHHHHALEEDQVAVEDHHDHNGHHHNHDTDKGQDKPADHEASDSPLSHTFNPVEASVFLDNESRIFVVKKLQVDDTFAEVSNIPAFLVPDDNSKDIVVLPDEPVYFHPHFDASGLRAPPVNFYL